MVSFANRAIVPEHVLVRHLDGESVLLNLNTEKYFGLDAMGTRMFALVTASPCIESAYEKLLEEYEVQGEVLRGSSCRTFEPPGGQWAAGRVACRCGNDSGGLAL
jgi:hypothetical protein